MRALLFAAVASLVLAAASAAAAATVEVKDAWIRTPPPGAPTAAGYATLTNHEISSDRLMGAHSAAAGVALHQMSMTGGVMRMRPVTGGLPIGASASVSLSPNGYHLMLTGLKAPLKAGQHVRIVLQFQRAGDIAADFVVRDAGPGGMHM
jgi:copper(I)-binding protein